MESIFPSKSGTDTAVMGGVYLHSSYDPRREAEKYVETLDIPGPGAVILFLGSCLGYIEDALIKKYPGIKICRVYFSDFFYARGRCPADYADMYWHPGKSEAFPRFLSRNISEEEFSRLRVIEWEPAFRAYPERAEKILSETAQYCRETNGSLLTLKAFGRRWIRNSLRNFLHLDYGRRLEKVSGPILIAASGVSLRSVMPEIRRFRGRFSLWALPSAMDYLVHHKVFPDLIVLTDPGYYSSFHLHNCLRELRPSGMAVPLLLPLTAAFPTGPGGFSFSFFNQGTWYENILLQNFSPPPDLVPQNGTVAGTALEIALTKTEGPVFIAGLDLACRDIFEHVRPHALDRIVGEICSRLIPEESFRFEKLILRNPFNLGRGLRTSQALRTYAGWFQRQKNRWRDRVVRLNATPVDTGMQSAGAGVLEGLSGGKPECFFTPVKGPGRNEKEEILRRFISHYDLSSMILPLYRERPHESDNPG